MTTQQRGDFCFDYARENEGNVTFQCSNDASQWPWLQLHPAHNIAVQATNYFSLTGVSLFTGQMDGEKWTALTEFNWRIFDLGKGTKHPARGLATQEVDGIGYTCRFFDEDDLPVYDVSGAGVVFRNRDFKAWRAKNREEIMSLPEPADFEFAKPQEAGVKTAGECFVSPLRKDEAGVCVDALVTAQAGFAPVHPYHGGSGDHVNSSHLCDAAQQAAHLIRPADAYPYPKGGNVRFKRYVELDRPFRLRLQTISEADQKMQFAIEQGGHPCAELTFTFEE